jgi:hypothetical protein
MDTNTDTFLSVLEKRRVGTCLVCLEDDFTYPMPIQYQYAPLFPLRKAPFRFIYSCILSNRPQPRNETNKQQNADENANQYHPTFAFAQET